MAENLLDLDAVFGFDEQAAVTGAKLVLGPDADTQYIMVRKVPNDDYTLRLRELLIDNGDELECLEQVDAKAALKFDRKLQYQAAAETLVASFGPGLSLKGKKLKFSPKTATDLFVAFPALYEKFIAFATNRKNYPRAANVESVKKP